MAERAVRTKDEGEALDERQDDVRARVLSAAVTLIDKGGAATLSMREVARAAGVSHQAPYHYFADREAILAAVAEHGLDLLTERLVVAFEEDRSAVDRFYEAGIAYVTFACENPGLFRVMFRHDIVDPNRFPKLQTCGERAYDCLPVIVRALIAESVAPVPSEQGLIVLSWSVVHGLACLLLDGPLVFKMPNALTGVAQRDATIREALSAMRHLLEAASRQPGRRGGRGGAEASSTKAKGGKPPAAKRRAPKVSAPKRSTSKKG